MVPIKKDELSDKIVLCKWQSNPQETRWRIQTTRNEMSILNDCAKTSLSTQTLCIVCMLFHHHGRERKWKGPIWVHLAMFKCKPINLTSMYVCTDLACQLSSCRHLY
ncbi:Uncharacterized protein APZ42_023472 [Daphnia magna]|uniref:Uncharacterized protein n=1 Tax=Daphnia magna TaxID=35525 RepID=A0A164UXT5_9CRUS|nr:Uncharacterized protein APZ42_023472 [Daphnia magna]